MSISPEEVQSIAKLAKLRLTSDEVAAMSHQLSSILEHMDALGRVDASELEPVIGVADGAARLRPDVPGSDPLANAPAQIAPDWRDGFFVVPRLAALDADTIDAGGGA